MNRFLTVLALTPLLLTACSRAPAVGEDLEQKLGNPLYAKQYYREQMDYMVSLVIRNDPQAMSGATADLINDARISSLDKARAASALELTGARGTFAGPMREVTGNVVLLNDTLFIGPDFATSPGLDLRMLLTNTDPSDIAFPDATTTDLGPLKDAFGAQSYIVPPEAQNAAMVVLWDAKLKRLFGSAQLAR